MEQKTNRIISYSIISIWGIIIIFGIITVLNPAWLSNLTNDGKNVEAISLKNHGDNFLKSKKYRLAIAQYTTALKINPELKSAIANLAIAYQKMGSYTKAALSFEYLLTLDPEYPGIIYYNLGDIYEKTGQPEKSVAYYLMAANTSSFPEKSYQKAGKIYMDKKNYDKAIINYKLAIDNKPNIENSYKGMLLTIQKTYADTSDAYATIAEIINTNSYLKILPNFDNKIFNKQLNSNKDLAKTYNNIGYCLASQENYKEAQAYIKQAIVINPTYTEANNNLKIVTSFLNK